MNFLERVTRNNKEAARILDIFEDADCRKTEVLADYSRPVDHHTRPGACPQVPHWRDTPPATPGTYRWRLTSQWEEIRRELAGDGTVWSHLFMQFVPAVRVGGEWFY